MFLKCKRYSTTCYINFDRNVFFIYFQIIDTTMYFILPEKINLFLQHIDKNITGFFKVVHIKILDVIYSEGAGLWAGIKVEGS